MSWPTPQDFVEAVQNPSYCFSDQDLKAGRPVLTPLGLPKVVSGQFACVFKFTCGSKSWAVRCFVRDFPDTHQRYVAIGKELDLARFPFMADFSLLQQGIRVKGQWYPVLKMEWLSGKLLGDYIAENVRNRVALLSMAGEIAQIYSSLSSRGIAHGDLQHGNIIVVGNQPRLIDYDGMYVPALKGCGSHEIGHRNYQHPLRRESDYNDSIDRFSVLVIYASILMLAEDPELWTRLQGGDDNLLLRAVDYREPYNSVAFATLNKHPNSQIRLLASLVEQACYVARLEEISPALELPAATAPRHGALSGSSSTWIDQHRAASSTKQDAAPISDWLADHIKIDEPSFGSPQRSAKIFIFSAFTVLVASLVVLVAMPAVSVLALVFAAAAASMILVIAQYRSDPAVVAKRNQLKMLQESESLYRDRKREMLEVESGISRENQKFESFKQHVAAEISRIDALLATTLARFDSDANAKRQAIYAKRLQLDNSEKREQTAIVSRYNGLANGIRAEISNISSRLQSELDKELKRLQTAHVSAHLRQASIARAGISGIGEKLTERLLRSGVRNAEDAEWYRVQSVDGIGVQKAGAIRNWRNKVSAEATRTMSTRLPPHADQQIRVQHQSRLNAENVRLKEIETRQRSELDSMARSFDVQKEALRKDQELVEAENRKRIGEANGQAAGERSRIRKTLSDSSATFAAAMKAPSENFLTTRRSAVKAQYQRDIGRRKLAGYERINFARWVRVQLWN